MVRRTGRDGRESETNRREEPDLDPVSAAIAVLESAASQPAPIDFVLAAYFRSVRVPPGEARGAISVLVQNVYRHRLRLDWWLRRAGAAPSARNRVLAERALAAAGSREREGSPARIAGGSGKPLRLSIAELGLIRALAGHGLDHIEMPEAVRLECPEWAEARLRAALGARFMTELIALGAPPPVDLRVNTLGANREQVRAALARAGIECAPTPYSPWGLRAYGHPAVHGTEPYRVGWCELQDEGSQLVALLVGARPGMQVADYCSGAGGKALAIAAAMENRGRLVVCDVNPRRLERARLRLRKGGVHNAECRVLDEESRRWLKRHAGRFDRVLVDAPCSGIGSWRRNPDAKWGRASAGLESLLARQRDVLENAARLVAPGGRLVYATCSLLSSENEEPVLEFLARHPEFEPRAADAVWAEALPSKYPSAEKRWLLLTPAQHDTDGFFVAFLERRPK